MLAMAVVMVWDTGTSLAAKTETKEARYYEDSLNNLCVGLPTPNGLPEGCGWAAITGESDTAIGFLALLQNTTGSRNVAVGQGALELNISGRENTATGSAVIPAWQDLGARRDRIRRPGQARFDD